jgi:parallel beta-helix repeat protein
MGVLLGPSAAVAATFTVINGDNSGTGSLRDAIGQAEANDNDATVDLIQFDPSVTTVNVDSPQINISHPLTIDGPGAGVLDVQRDPAAGGAVRLFVVSPTAGQTVTIEGMTMSDATDRPVFKAGAGSLVLDSVWLTDNQTTASGGAIHCDGGPLLVENSTLSGNQANFAGGLSVNSNGGASTVCVADVVNSTISGNSANEFGGGIYVGGSGRISVNSSTIQGNKADADDTGGGGGGGTYNASGGTTPTFSVANTLYADNTVGTSGSATQTQCGGTYTSSGYNLRTVLEAGCTFSGTGEVVNANPMLGALGDNGGPTPTIALQEGSPAINAGNPTTPADDNPPVCPAEDQRGVTRGGGNGTCDIGAFEWQHPTTTAIACVPTAVTLGAGGSTCTATVADTAGTPATPTQSVDFTTNGTGTFSGSGTCALSEAILGEASCSVTYTPGAIGTGSHEITGVYGGDVGHDPSQGSTSLGVLAPSVTPPGTPVVVPVPGVAATDLKAAIKKCKKKFPKGPRRKKCIKKAKKRFPA